MTTNSTQERVRAFILDKFPLARRRGIRDDEPLLGTGILDSLGVLEVVSFLESDFNIQIDDEELIPDSFQSIRSIAEFVQRKTK